MVDWSAACPVGGWLCSIINGGALYRRKRVSMVMALSSFPRYNIFYFAFCVLCWVYHSEIPFILSISFLDVTKKRKKVLKGVQSLVKR